MDLIKHETATKEKVLHTTSTNLREIFVSRELKDQN